MLVFGGGTAGAPVRMHVPPLLPFSRNIDRIGNIQTETI